MDKSLRITIQGRTYGLRIHEENIPVMEALARSLDARLGEFRKQHPGQNELTAAIMTALNLAQDTHILQQKYDDLQQQYDEVVLAHEIHLEEVDEELDGLTVSLDVALQNGKTPTAD